MKLRMISVLAMFAALSNTSFAANAPSAPPAQAAVPAQPTSLSNGELDAILAPIALYPDALLSKILIASTFPDQVIDAANWQKANPGLKGDALDRAVSGKNWDQNVKALLQIPGVLDMMGGQQEWMFKLGGAFANQQADVMNAVQRLRHQAQAHGSLVSTQQQRVTEQGDTIIIEPAQPSIVYVPYYNPTIVYGVWLYPAYRPYYWATPYGYGYPVGPVAGGIIWGAAIGISVAVWSNAFNWHTHTVWYGGGWHSGGSWNHGYYNHWHGNNWHDGHYNGRHNNGNVGHRNGNAAGTRPAHVNHRQSTGHKGASGRSAGTNHTPNRSRAHANGGRASGSHVRHR